MTNHSKPSNMSDKDKTRPRGRPKASGIRKLSKSVTVKFSRIDYERLLHRSRQANRTLAEFIREAAFEARIVARHSTEEAAVIRNLVGMANNLNQLARLSHQTGFYRTRNAVMELLEKLKVIMNEYKKWKGGIHDRQNQERQILWRLHPLRDGKGQCRDHRFRWRIAGQ